MTNSELSFTLSGYPNPDAISLLPSVTFSCESTRPGNYCNKVGEEIIMAAVTGRTVWQRSAVSLSGQGEGDEYADRTGAKGLAAGWSHQAGEQTAHNGTLENNRVNCAIC